VFIIPFNELSLLNKVLVALELVIAAGNNCNGYDYSVVGKPAGGL